MCAHGGTLDDQNVTEISTLRKVDVDVSPGHRGVRTNAVRPPQKDSNEGESDEIDASVFFFFYVPHTGQGNMALLGVFDLGLQGKKTGLDIGTLQETGGSRIIK